jgi:hypothetical protein
LSLGQEIVCVYITMFAGENLMTRPDVVSAVRLFLTTRFTDDELRQLCYDSPDFRRVYRQLKPGMAKSEIIERMLDAAGRQGGLEPLLAQAKAKRPDSPRPASAERPGPETPAPAQPGGSGGVGSRGMGGRGDGGWMASNEFDAWYEKRVGNTLRTPYRTRFCSGSRSVAMDQDYNGWEKGTDKKSQIRSFS